MNANAGTYAMRWECVGLVLGVALFMVLVAVPGIAHPWEVLMTIAGFFQCWTMGILLGRCVQELARLRG